MSKRKSAWALATLIALFLARDARGIDCNGNGAADAVDIAEASSDDCNVNGIPDECEGLPFRLSAGTESYEVPRTPRIVSAVDLDRDGEIDIVVGSRGSKSAISILRNRGDRNFESALGHEVDGPLYALASGDFDGDGDVDIASAHVDFVLVSLNAGDGTLLEPTRYEHSFGVRFLTIADLDGDGVPDLITTDRDTSTISIHAGDGAGTFQQPAPFPAGGVPASVTTNDLDGDGDLDVAVTHVGSSTVALLVNEGGALTEPRLYSTGATKPTSIEASDFDVDGSDDIVIGTRTSVVVFRNHGDGSLGETTLFPDTGVNLTVGDFNGDGLPDLARGTSPNVITVRGNNGGSPFGVRTQILGLANRPTDLASADFDLDGQLDLALITADPSSVSLVWNGGGNSPVLSTELVRLSGCQRNQGCRPHGGVVVDVELDGDMDVVAVTTHPAALTVLLNDGGGSLSGAPSPPFGGEHPQAMTAGDVNQDGYSDLVTIDNWGEAVAIHTNSGQGGFLPPLWVTVGPAPIFADLADFDGDGYLDVASANQGDHTASVALNHRDGTFGAPQAYRTGNDPKGVAGADLDGDGDTDLAVANFGSASLTVLFNTGDGTLEGTQDLILPGNPNHVVAADVNQDGIADLVSSNLGRQSASVVLSRGGRQFEPPIEVGVGAPPYSAVVVDFDADGVPDLVTVSEGAGRLSILRGRGDGSFEPPFRFATAGAAAGTRWVLPADLDGDGDLDLVTVNREGQSHTLVFNELSREAADALNSICTPSEFESFSRTGGESDAPHRSLKFTLPVGTDPASLPTVFQNTRRFPLHLEFLSQVFPERFPNLTPAEYDALVGRRATRQYWSGTISRLTTERGFLYGFSIFARWNDPAEALTAAEVQEIHDRIRESFLLEPVVYAPSTRAAAEVARTWENPDFPIHFSDGSGDGLPYQGYTQGIAYGRVRIFGNGPAAEGFFGEANDNGDLSFQDVLVLPHAPRYVDGVVGGVITAERQGELGHVAVQAARRGTPNAYLAAATEVLAPYAGKLVRLGIGATSYTVEEATLSEAEDWWAQNHPSVRRLPQVDAAFAGFASLTEIAAMDADAEFGDLEARFGGSATHLARLQSVLEGPWSQYKIPGFAVPVRDYLEYMRTNRMPSALEPARTVTYAEYLTELFASTEFQGSPSFRFATLRLLRTHMTEEGQVDTELVRALAARVAEVFGKTDAGVRFLPSSNLEDAIEWGGVRLYDSASACADDDLDDDGAGPSHCDPTDDDEHGIAQALQQVWASLWNFRAHEERAFYGIPQGLAVMGVLVTQGFVGERAGGVAFTGNPSNHEDRRYIVSVQEGETSVASPDLGEIPETNVLEVQEGRVTHITRTVTSSLVPAGVSILSETELEELGALLWHVDQEFPLDLGKHRREDVLLDVEFKMERGGGLAVQQVRPFLLVSPPAPTPTFALEIADATMACGVFQQGRDARREYELKSTLRLRPGTTSLPSGPGSFAADLVAELVVGPNQELAEPLDAGRFDVIPIPAGEGRTVYRFEYRQDFSLASEGLIELRLLQLDFQVAADPLADSDTTRVLDNEALSERSFVRATLTRAEEVADVVYSSCSYDALPLWNVGVELADGGVLHLEERFRPELFRDIGPASLTRAEFVRDGTRHLVTDYWRLVYTAARHNERVVYWVALQPPLILTGVAGPVAFVELRAPSPELQIESSASYLGSDFELLAMVDVVSFGKELASLAPRFRRGDVSAEGSINITDAVGLLNYLFARGAPPLCSLSADANDDGKLNLADAIWILLHVTGNGGPLPEPFLACGTDPTADLLSCTSYPPCAEE
jgi:hypothetical protein